MHDMLKVVFLGRRYIGGKGIPRDDPTRNKRTPKNPCGVVYVV